MQRAADPATCGEAMLVPLRVLYPPPGQVEMMQTPGAAMVWLWSSALTAKLLKSAALSSTSTRQVGAAPPPGRPSKSATAVTVSTSGNVAGTKVLKSAAALPAATTKVTPAAVARQIA